MLIDEWIATSEVELREPDSVWLPEQSQFSRAERLRQTSHTLDAMKRAQNFVASPLVVETASALADDLDALKRSATHFFTPAERTWIDMSANRPAGGVEGRHGVLLIGQNGSLMKGEGMVVVHVRRSPSADLPDSGGGGFMQVGFTYDVSAGNLGTIAYPQQAMTFAVAGGAIHTLLGAMWATIALINTPRISHVTTADLSRINKSRLRQRKPPILQHKIVSIHIDRGALGQGHQGHETGERPLHHVRAFMRIKRGRVELVRPHWRGNPRFGVVVHRYVAVREEDTAGPWQGGPTPPPRIIKELDET